jgi:hypothetical protein
MGKKGPGRGKCKVSAIEHARPSYHPSTCPSFNQNKTYKSWLDDWEGLIKTAHRYAALGIHSKNTLAFFLKLFQLIRDTDNCTDNWTDRYDESVRVSSS